MEKLDGKKAIIIGLGLSAAALVGAAAYGAIRFHSWKQDEYATEMWLHLGKKGLRFTKDPEGGGVTVQSGFRWMPDEDYVSELNEEEPEIEIVLPDEETTDAEA